MSDCYRRSGFYSAFLVFATLFTSGWICCRVFLDYPVKFYIMGYIIKIQRHPHLSGSIPWVTNNPRTDLADSHVKRPNILLLIADDLGFNNLNGGAGVQTPNIMSIAENGVNFKKSYAGHATCAPSRAAIMTGRYATRFGFEFTPVPTLLADMIGEAHMDHFHPAVLHREKYQDIPHMSKMVVPTNETFIPRHLSDLGYRSYYLGKWHLGESPDATPLSRGFDESLSFLSGASLYMDKTSPDIVNAPVHDALDDFLWFNLGFTVQHNDGPFLTPNKYMTEYLADQAISAMEKHVDFYRDSPHPFFITVAFNAPHDPLQALRSDYESEEVSKINGHVRKVYGSMIRSLDRSIGRILEALKKSGQYDNTLVIFTSDNGGAHYIGLDEMNHPFRGWKATLFEGGIRVPFFMQWPKVLPAKYSYEEPVAHVDIFETIVSAANLVVSDDESTCASTDVHLLNIDGEDLLKYLPLKQKGHFDLSHRLSHPHASLYWRSGHYRSIMIDGWKLQLCLNPPRMWFFNLNEDPIEHMNLISNDRWLQPFAQCSQVCPVTNASHICSSLRYHPLESSVFHDVSSTMKMSSEDVAVAARHLWKEMWLVDQSQACPLWPAAIEVAIPINHSKECTSAEDEYAYWCN